jgi:hypothetical protein
MNNKMQTPSQLDSGPWYRQPWPWILMAGPVLAMVGCALTISFAFTNFADQPLQDGGMKRGLVVEKNANKPISTSEAVTR